MRNKVFSKLKNSICVLSILIVPFLMITLFVYECKYAWILIHTGDSSLISNDI